MRPLLDETGEMCWINLVVRPETLTSMRRVVRAHLALWDQPSLSDVAELGVTELLSNVLRHTSGARCTVIMEPRGTAIRFCVVDPDPDPGLPGPRRPSGPALWRTDGRGLMMIDALADEWGVEPVGSGKSVWFSLKAVG
ncbi:ATP-binding protein [Allostreptomyces psammosilenae]|uniref:Anti-sigma regulatory factor (Ser/Thr protein kinase) n=1 Tax=Allostreptomyces psammosilenae TaxID=1892865 RepID=A0A852ZRX9_9ACTN|nr:ATP-binding protein [Allostreptomyces psammosilenae]NYI05143.1 anti-sigma regulatory factor (Ser/Thr protein kinase) [Allostreptomyces psammosilenae]